jgi:membrane protease subunit HflK
MPWNEPEKNSKQHDPWGGKNNQSPPDLDKLIGDMIKKVRDAFSFKKKGNGNGNWQTPPSSTNGKPKDHRYGIGITFAALFALWFLSGFFIVNPAEEAVILRFGKFSDVVQPGLHWMARFIETKYVLDVQKIYSFSLDGDFLTKSSDQNDMPAQYIQVATKALNDQSKNLVNVELNVQYRINDPRLYLFNVVNPDGTVQEVASGALSDVIGKMKLDEVLTTGRETLSAGVLARSRAILKNYNAGIEILSVTLRKVQAPDQVRRAFTDVNRADQDKATLIQQAQAYASKVVPLAQGMAARTLADANGYQQQVVLTAEAQVARYQALFQAYVNSPVVTRERMYLDTMQNVLTRSTKILVEGNAGNNMLYLPLDKLIKQDEDNTVVDENNVLFKQPVSSVVSSAGVNTVNAAQPTPTTEAKNVSN